MATVIYFIPIVVSTVMYSCVLCVALKQADSINRMRPSNGGNSVHNKKLGRRLKHDLRAARTISVVFAAYTICWLPHFIIILIGIWDLPTMIKLKFEHPLAYDCISTTFNYILPTINSCINPFIYFLFGANFRLAFKDVLYKLLKKPRNELLYPDECNNSVYTTNGYEIPRKETDPLNSEVHHTNGLNQLKGVNLWNEPRPLWLPENAVRLGNCPCGIAPRRSFHGRFPGNQWRWGDWNIFSWSFNLTCSTSLNHRPPYKIISSIGSTNPVVFYPFQKIPKLVKKIFCRRSSVT